MFSWSQDEAGDVGDDDVDDFREANKGERKVE